MTSSNTNNILLYVIIVPLFLLALILFLSFYLRHHHQRKLPHPHHSHCIDSLKSSIKPRQPFIHHNAGLVPSTSSDHASLTSSNLYYARIQAI